ncbi:acyltransferase family protein [Paenibacillus marinisediminis]
MEKEKVDFLSIYRAMAIMAVILIHSTSQPVAAAKTSDLYYIYVFLNIAAKFAVPSFICLTAFVLFYNYAHRGLKPAQIMSFYYKRLKYILVPYFMASLCYFVLVQTIRGDFGLSWAQLRLLGEELLTGTAYTHLYYIVIIVQFYLLFPIHLLLSRSRTFVKYSIWIGLLLQWAFVLLNKYEWQLPRTGSIFLSYMSIWMLGASSGSIGRDVELGSNLCSILLPTVDT